MSTIQLSGALPAKLLPANKALLAVHNWLTSNYDLRVVELSASERNKTTEYESIGVELKTELMAAGAAQPLSSFLNQPYTIEGVSPDTIQWLGGTSMLPDYITSFQKEEAEGHVAVELPKVGVFWLKFAQRSAPGSAPLTDFERGMLQGFWTRALQLSVSELWQSPWIIQGRNQQQRTKEEKDHFKWVYEAWLLEVLHARPTQ